MTLYQYRARDASGRPLDGQLDAPSMSAAASQLMNNGLTPVEVEGAEDTQASDLRRQIFGMPRVRLDDLVIFSRQMHTLTRSGVPMVRSLSCLAETSTNPTLARTLVEIANTLQSGRSLGAAFEQHPDIFSPLFVNTVRVGETTGHLEDGFANLAMHLERESETLKRIRSATRYPTMVIAAVVIAIVVINIFVVPAFSKVFESFGQELPLPTRLLIGSSDLMLGYWPLLLGAVLLGTFGVRRWLATKRGRYLWDRTKLRMPVVGRILERATLARFARGYAMASKAGVPVIQSLQIVARALDNAFVCERITGLSERVSRGETLSASAAGSGLFTPLVLQMISVGEESGSVDELLEEVADYYEREVDHDLKRLSDAIEPILIVFLGGIVLILALGVYLPLWNMASLAQG